MIPVTQFDPTVVAANDNTPTLSTVEKCFVRNVAETAIEGGTDPTVGEVTWRTLICADQTPTANFVLGVAEFPAFGRLHPHRHKPAEYYFGLTGSGIVTLDGIEQVITPGTAIYIPGNVEHGVKADKGGLTFAYGFPKNAFSEVEYVFSEGNSHA